MLSHDDEELLAEALYGEPDAEDRERIEAILAKDSELAAEYRALRLLVRRIPVDEPVLTPNLAPGVMASLDTPQPRGRFLFSWRMASAAVLVAVAVLVFGVLRNEPAHAPMEVAQSPAEAALAQADRLRAERDYAGAYRALEAALPEVEGAEASDLLRRMATLAYEDLHWYPEAMARYDALRKQYFEAFQADNEAIYRLNVLEESAGPNRDFAPLVAVTAAAESGSVDELEAVIVRYPGSVAAKMAAAESARLSARSLGLDESAASRLAALEQVLANADHPAVRAHLQLAAAEVARDELRDPERARPWYEAVLRSGVSGLENQARTALAALEREDTP